MGNLAVALYACIMCRKTPTVIHLYVQIQYNNMQTANSSSRLLDYSPTAFLVEVYNLIYMLVNSLGYGDCNSKNEALAHFLKIYENISFKRTEVWLNECCDGASK